MSQHFLLSSRAKTLTLASVAGMSDEEAEAIFRKIRWASNGGDPVSPKCGCTIVYDCRRANGTALALQGVSPQLLDYERDIVSLAENAATRVPVRYCDLLQRGQGQEDAGAFS